jgi:hydrogenase expression/formation protein HypC
MCVSLVGQIVELDGEQATIDADGSLRRVSLAVLLLEGRTVEPGDHVLVHTGFAVSILDPGEAAELAEQWREIADHPNGTSTTKELEP